MSTHSPKAIGLVCLAILLTCCNSKDIKRLLALKAAIDAEIGTDVEVALATTTTVVATGSTLGEMVKLPSQGSALWVGAEHFPQGLKPSANRVSAILWQKKGFHFDTISFVEFSKTLGATQATIITGKRPLETDRQEQVLVYVQKCQSGDSKACSFAAQRYRLGDGVEKDPKLALQYYKKACDGGQGMDCYNLGVLLDAEKAPHATIKPIMQRACDLGDQDGCNFVEGKQPTDLNGYVEIPLPGGGSYKGEVLNGKKHGFGTLSSQKGYSYTGHFKNDEQHGQGTTIYPDGARYKGNYANGQKHGFGIMTEADGNAMFAEWENDRPNLGRDKQTRDRWLSLCKKGDYSFCFLRGIVMASTDPGESKGLFESACQNKFGPACAVLGTQHQRNGKTRLAIELYQSACRAEDALGCSNLAAIYQHVGDKKKARSYSKKACELGDSIECSRTY